MLPVRIKPHVFQMLMNVMNDDDIALINKAYRLDENPLDAIYVLLPVDSTSEEWKKFESQLAKIVRYASNICLKTNTISQSERDEFHISGNVPLLRFHFMI